MAELEFELEALGKDLSIVVPVYKISSRSDNFEKWISSPLIKFAEIILVHDLSDGENCDFLRKYSSQLPNVTLIEEFCGSPGKSRNVGLGITSRPWVVFWDCDDYPHIREVLKLLDKTIKSEATHGVGSFNVIQRDTGNVLGEFKNSDLKIDSQIAKWIATPGLWRWVFNRADIDELKFKTIPIGEDVLFLIESNAIDCELYVSHDVTYSYYVGDVNQQTFKVDNVMRLAAIEGIEKAISKCKPLSKKFGVVVNLRLKIGLLMNGNFQDKIVKSPKLLKLAIRLTAHSKGNFQNLRLFLRRQNFQKRIIQKSMVSIYMAGGLGNQLFQLSFGIYISKGSNLQLIGASNEISLLVEKFNSDLRRPKGESRILLRGKIGLVEAKLRNFLISRRKVYFKNTVNRWVHSKFSLMVRKILSRITNVKSVYVAPAVGYDEAVENFSGIDSAFIGYFQSYLYAEPAVEVIRKMLDLSVSENLQFCELMEEAKKKEIVAVQVRLGDYNAKSNHEFGVISREYLSRSIDLIKNLTDFDEIWVFSDDVNLAKEVFPLQNHPVRWMPNHTFGNLETLLLMSQASSFVISNSTFGWWGATLSKARNKHVVCPSPWFKEMVDPSLIAPISWHRIPDPF